VPCDQHGHHGKGTPTEQTGRSHPEGLPDALVVCVCDEEIAHSVHCDAQRTVQLGGCRDADGACESDLSVPLPATVEIVPSDETLRMRGRLISAKKTLPAVSTATKVGELSRASVAGAPSSRLTRHRPWS
jgi:hypothetical protein